MKTKRIIKKARHMTLRLPGNIDAIVERHRKRTGYTRTRVICDLILWSDSVDRDGKLPVLR